MTPEEKQARLMQISERIKQLKERLVCIPLEIARLEEAKRITRVQGLQRLGQAQEQIKEGKNHALIKESAEESEELQRELRGIGRNMQKLLQEKSDILTELDALEAEKKNLFAR